MPHKRQEAAAEHNYAQALVAGAAMTVLAATLALLAAWANAAALGNLTVTSAAGQALRAEVDVRATKAELDALGARLAGAELHRGAGAEYPASLPLLQFALARRPGGRHVVAVTSQRPINEPVLDFVVEIAWRTAVRSYRYTVLMDPPGAAPRSVAPAWASPAPAPIALATMEERPRAVAARQERTAGQLRLKEEVAAIQKMKLAEARERIVELESTVRQQQQLLDMESAAAEAAVRASTARHAKGGDVAGRLAPAPAHAAAASTAVWTDAVSQHAPLAAASAALLLGVAIVARRRGRGGASAAHSVAVPQPA